MKIAVVLFNLGGPDSLEAVQPFLFRLFFDPAIIRVPTPIRYLLAQLISRRRAPFTKKIYELIGNKSPLLELTQMQADALKAQLNQGRDVYECFICMRYWHPMVDEVAAKVKAYNPDEIILLPLYPQFSTTTTDSSIQQWRKTAKKMGITAAEKTIGCYPFEASFIQAHVELLSTELEKLSDKNNLRLLFSAHGLPEKIIAAGDPYQWQVEQTVQYVVKTLEKRFGMLDYSICYQSRVGPLAWIGPSTEEEIKRAGSDGKTLLLTPIAFVSEHSETLVELDVEYRHLATEAGVLDYIRIPALGVHPAFIQALKNLCEKARLQSGGSTISSEISPICPASFSECLCRNNQPNY